MPQVVQKKISTLAAKVAARPIYARLFVVGCLCILFGTTLLWAGLGAKIHEGNADQLVDAYLFESKDTFQQAEFPSQHSYLLKWPLFWLIKVFGFSEFTFMAFTVVLGLMTVSFIAWLLHRIERRPFVFGALCLALACVLMATPTQPYPGGILPINLAMITTRNIEYVIYIVSLLLLLRAQRFRSFTFLAGAGLLALLIASDKLFLPLGIGAAALALVAYAVVRRWTLTSLAAKWLVATFLASAAALFLLWSIQASGLTHLVGSGSSPYGLISSPKDLMLGSVYVLISLLTNFGANPVHDTRLFDSFLDQAKEAFISPAGFVYVINAVIFAGSLYAMYKLVRRSITHHKELDRHFDIYGRLGLVLVWTSLVAAAAFVATQHYYPVDARYLAIALFAGFVSLAVVISKRQLKTEWVLGVSVVLVIGLASGLYTMFQGYEAEKTALAPFNKRNSRVAQILDTHPVDVLVGDYWRVVPTRLAAKDKLAVMPLSDCTQAQNYLSSKHWQKNLQDHSFAYLLSFDQNLTNSPRCSLQEIIKAYGRPNTSVVIEGQVDNPKEVLLFYDQGIRSSPKSSSAEPLASVVPVLTEQLKDTICAAPTIMNIVAHQDDDLLFMSPDLIHDVRAGHCVRTIYVTAGDAGLGEYYWLRREQGSEAAYAEMMHSTELWVQRIVKIAEKQFITVASPKNNPALSLIYLRLPDGSPKGEGFTSHRSESLKKLETGHIHTMSSVDGQSSYSSQQLVAALTQLMQAYRPAEIRTQASDHHTSRHDHTDHIAVGRYADQAYDEYLRRQYEGRPLIPLTFYAGYPGSLRPQNVFDKDLEAKQAAFAAYAQFDSGVCSPPKQPCKPASVYEDYVKRQYLEAY